MEYGSFYECLGKMLLSTEAEDVKAQAELILELELGLQNTHVEQTIFDMLKTEIELENKDIAATKFYSLVSRDSPALLRPLPLSRRRGATRLHHPHPPGYEGQPLRERERERESRFSGLSC